MTSDGALRCPVGVRHGIEAVLASLVLDRQHPPEVGQYRLTGEIRKNVGQCQVSLVARRLWQRHRQSSRTWRDGLSWAKRTSTAPRKQRIVALRQQFHRVVPSTCPGTCCRARIYPYQSRSRYGAVIEATAHLGRFLPRLGPTT